MATRSETDSSASPAPVPWRLDAQDVRERLGRFSVEPISLEGRKHAAVAVGISQAGCGPELPGLAQYAQWSEAPALLLTRRAARMRAHAGQWALPGGRIEPGETPEEAALREMAEEIGLTLGPQDVLGRMDDYATRSGYVITPVVVWAGPAAELRPEPTEVQSIHRIPVAELLRADAPLLNQARSREQPVLRMPVGNGWIAAPTAAFLYQFREWLLLGRPTRVAHFDQPYFAWR